MSGEVSSGIWLASDGSYSTWGEFPIKLCGILGGFDGTGLVT